MVCAFLPEYSLSFSLAQPLIGTCKELSKDSAALKRLHMFRTTARFVLISFPKISILFEYKLLNFCLFNFSFKYLNLQTTTAKLPFITITISLPYYSYQLVHDLSKTLSDEHMAKLRSTPFSMNMDEATATNNM